MAIGTHQIAEKFDHGSSPRGPTACGERPGVSPNSFDDPLLRLSRFDVLARILLGRIVAEMLRRRVHHDLGFIRLDDYSNERLGICAGEMRALGRVASALETLEAVKAAVERGALNWTKLRTIACVADVSTRSLWP